MTFRRHLAELAAQKTRIPFHGNLIGLSSNLHPIVNLFPVWDLENWDNRWCAAFVYYCCVEAGYKIPVKSDHESVPCNFAGVSAWEAWAKLDENDFFYEGKDNAFIPDVGDIVLYDFVFINQEHDHIGIVVGVENDTLRVAEGNVGNISAIVTRKRDDNVRGYIRISDKWQCEI